MNNDSSKPADLPAEAHEALAAGRKVEAIKIARGVLGIGLKEAKDLVEAQPSPANPDANAPLTVERSQRSAAPIVVVLMLIIAAVAAFLLS